MCIVGRSRGLPDAFLTNVTLRPIVGVILRGRILHEILHAIRALIIASECVCAILCVIVRVTLRVILRMLLLIIMCSANQRANCKHLIDYPGQQDANCQTLIDYLRPLASPPMIRPCEFTFIIRSHTNTHHAFYPESLKTKY